MTVEVELSPEELAAFRQRVATAHQRRRCTFKRPVMVQYMDGPLAGIRHPVEQSEMRSSSLGWCLVMPNGPHVAEYRPVDDGLSWKFCGWETPGIR
jgi:hypothetical protein